LFLREGFGEIINNGNDLTLIATGKTVYDAMEAAKILKQKNISCRVINMCTLKPIDRQLIIESAIETKDIITIEEHKTTGGLGSIVSEILCLNVDKYVPFKTIGVDTDCFYKNLRYNQAKEEYGITPANIVSTTELIYKGAK
jgi:transketolase